MLCLPHILALALHSQGGFNTAVPGLGALCRHGADDAWLLGAVRRASQDVPGSGQEPRQPAEQGPQGLEVLTC